MAGARVGYAARSVVESLERRCLLSAGDLDPTFGRGGIVRSELYPPYQPGPGALVLQGDGKFVTGGTFEVYRDYDPFPAGFALARYHPDGTADLAFGDAGYVNAAVPGAAEASVTDVVVQGDGKIVAAGWAKVGGDNRFAVARFHPDGSPDTSFSGDGFVTIDFTAGNDNPSGVAIDPRNGRIVVAGTSAEGTAAANFIFARLLPGGALDASFSGDGRRTMDIGGNRQDQLRAVLVQGDGKVVAGGWRVGPSGYSDFVVVRLAANGADDNTFTSDGRAITDFQGQDDRIHDLAFGPGGSIIAAGSAWADHEERAKDDYALARYTAAGALDTAFGGGDGKVQTDDLDSGWNDHWLAVSVMADGRIVTAGSNRHGDSDGAMVAGRYLPDGTLDAAFAGDGLFEPGDDLSFAADLAIQADGKPLILGRAGTESGSAGVALWRLTTAGVRDPAFGRGAGRTAGQINGRMEGFFGGIAALAFQDDGKVLAAGQFRAYFPYEQDRHYALARYNADGSLDTSFADKGVWAPSSEFGSTINAIGVAALAGGKILVVGHRDDALFAARLNPDGSPDPSYGASGMVTAGMAYSDVAIAPDGSLVVARLTNDGVGENREPSRLVARRYTASGQPDPAFGAGEKTLRQFPPGSEVGPSVTLAGLALDDSGRILAAWFDWSDAPVGGPTVARYTPAGNPDGSFGAGGEVALGQDGHVDVYDLIVDGAGRPLVGLRSSSQDSAVEVKRLTTAGAPDATFGAGGTAFVFDADNLSSLVLQQDGRIVATGMIAWRAVVVARLTPAGRPDPTFDGDGRATVEVSVPYLAEIYPTAAVVDRQGRIVVGGFAHSLSRRTSAAFLLSLEGGAGAPALPGDLNVDGAVNGSDFAILARHFGRTGMTYHDGDINGDGRVDGADFSILAGNFGKTL